jgi:hypothetical protein
MNVTVSSNGSCVAGLVGPPSAITAVLMQQCQSDWYTPQLLLGAWSNPSHL